MKRDHLSFEYISDLKFWSTLGMLSYVLNQAIQKINFIPLLVLHCTFRNPTIWSVVSIFLLEQFCHTWNLEWEVRYRSNSPFETILRKIKWQKFIKTYKMPYFGPFLRRYEQKWIFCKNLLYCKLTNTLYFISPQGF